MSEVDSLSDAVVADAGQAARLLRQARESVGVPLPSLAATLKVPLAKLEALEAGRLQDLPDLTFARALARSVCRVLKVDATEVLACFPQAAQVRLVETQTELNAPFPKRSGPSLGKLDVAAHRLGRTPWLVAAGLTAAAVALWVALPHEAEVKPTEVLAPATEAVPAVVEEPVQASMVIQEVVTALPTTAPIPATQSESIPPAVAGLPPAVPAAPPSASPPVVPPAASENAVAAAEALLLKVQDSTWVQVTGASGKVLLQRNLRAGEQVALSEDTPLSVVLGRADGAEVRVRGALLDLTPFTRNRVARFEVK